MCEYIIAEDFLMDKYIYHKSNGLWYVLTVDWLGWLCYLV